jgi:hypothetical protein
MDAHDVQGSRTLSPELDNTQGKSPTLYDDDTV